nr:hypothetical protein [Tanacetum cinerariifolium]
MTAPVMLISSNSSDESVGSSTSWIILFGTILAEIPVEILTIPPSIPEVGVAVVASPTGVLDLITYSFTDSDSSKNPHAPVTSPFLHSSNSSKTSRDSVVSGSLRDHNHRTRMRIVLAPPGIPRRFGHSLNYSSPDSLFVSSSHLVTHHSPSPSTGPSHKRCRSSTTYVPSTIYALGALSPTRADILPPHKRFRSSSAALSLEASVEGIMETGS